MTRLLIITLTISSGLFFACLPKQHSQPPLLCDCDTLKTKKIIASKDFNRIPQYDTATFPEANFYQLDSAINRMLWYRDIENIDTTRFTSLWDAYSKDNYHASHLDFITFYKNKMGIELAFQFGPNSDLWAYHTFVIKKVECCYLVTRSYFKHARFTYKAWSILNNHQLDTLYSILDRTNTQPIGKKEEFKFCGYFADNRSGRTFFIDFESEVEKSNTEEKFPKPKKEIEELYDFVDKKIKWTKTY